jgi:hypothetical protein
MGQDEKSFEATLVQAARDYVVLRDGDGEFNKGNLFEVFDRYFHVNNLKCFESVNYNSNIDSGMNKAVYFGLAAGEEVVNLRFKYDDYEQVDFDKFAITDLNLPLQINEESGLVWDITDHTWFVERSNESRFGRLICLSDSNTGSFFKSDARNASSNLDVVLNGDLVRSIEANLNPAKDNNSTHLGDGYVNAFLRHAVYEKVMLRTLK